MKNLKFINLPDEQKCGGFSVMKYGDKLNTTKGAATLIGPTLNNNVVVRIGDNKEWTIIKSSEVLNDGNK